MSEEKSKLTSLSTTRWSCRADDTCALVNSFDGIRETLSILIRDETKKSETQREALSLLSKITKLENAFMAVLWNRILNRFNTVSQFLQKV